MTCYNPTWMLLRIDTHMEYHLLFILYAHGLINPTHKQQNALAHGCIVQGFQLVFFFNTHTHTYRNTSNMPVQSAGVRSAPHPRLSYFCVAFCSDQQRNGNMSKINNQTAISPKGINGISFGEVDFYRLSPVRNCHKKDIYVLYIFMYIGL